MTAPIHWQFPRNVTNSPIGPRNSGIEQYTAKRLESLVRETIQNSLDAQEKQGKAPARISFQTEDIPTESFNGRELAEAVKASIEGLKDADGAYRKMLEKAEKELRQVKIPTLVIADSGTTGAYDDSTEYCPWAALTRGSGESHKPSKNSSGSYGIGKAAAFAVTGCRTVLYTTAFQAKGDLESRFIGRVILSGHKDKQGQKVTGEGYLSADNYISLSNSQIPVPFRIGKTGTCLWIPGYADFSKQQDEIIRISIANFFHAIGKGELVVTVGERTVDAARVREYTELLNPKEKRLLNTSRQKPVAETSIPGIGEVSLRISLLPASENVHEVALVRDAGMMITGDRNKMGPAKITIPRHWNSFTAIVECLSDPGPDTISAVRDCESPKHDELDLDRIPNEEDRKPAREALKELGSWMRAEISLRAETASNTEPVNAVETAEFLPINSTESNPKGRPQGSGEKISRPVQRGSSVPARRVKPLDPETGIEGKRKKPPRRPAPPKNQPVIQQDTLARAKFRPGRRHSTHGLTIQISPLDKRIDDLQILAVTEYGKSVPMKILKVWSKGKALKTSRGKISTLLPDDKNPIILEVNLQEPVAGRRFSLKGSGKGRGSQ